MSDDKPRDTQPDDETQPVRPGAALPPAPAPDSADATAGDAAAGGPAPAPVAATGRRGFRERLRTLRRTEAGDRTYGLAALVASALAGVIVGGVGLAAVHAVTDDHRDGPGWGERHGPMGRDLGGDDDRGPGFGGPGHVPGQLQPTTPPDEDDESGSSS
jgi:hypothetical protein